MSENETRVNDDLKTETKVNSVSTEETAGGSKFKGYTAAVVIVALIILGVLYFMEKEGRSSTKIFESVISGQESGEVVAEVNGEKIVNSDLTASVQQLTQAAEAQGVDVTKPEAQSEIRSQALDVLINTELLKQAAVEAGFEVSDEELESRIKTIETDIGGPEVLSQRLTELGISTDKLESDVKDEILIQKLLDSVFLGSGLAVTEEEINQMYDAASSSGTELPPLEEVRDQVEAQIKSSKEQEAIDKYLGELKAEAEISIK